jgi:hypothetical protein
MFCSIEDAWGEKSFADKQLFKQSDKPEHFTNETIIKQTEQKDETLYSKYMELKDMFENGSGPNDSLEHFAQEAENNESQVCLALDSHLDKCSRCRTKYLKSHGNKNVLRSRNQNDIQPFYGYGSNLRDFNFNFSSITSGIRTNKDIITIFLFGLLVILLLQLFSK